MMSKFHILYILVVCYHVESLFFSKRGNCIRLTLCNLTLILTITDLQNSEGGRVSSVSIHKQGLFIDILLYLLGGS